MSTLTVGSQFTTLKSGVEGTIEEIVQNPSGSVRVRLMTVSGERWTTVKQFDIMSKQINSGLGYATRS